MSQGHARFELISVSLQSGLLSWKRFSSPSTGTSCTRESDFDEEEHDAALADDVEALVFFCVTAEKRRLCCNR